MASSLSRGEGARPKAERRVYVLLVGAGVVFGLALVHIFITLIFRIAFRLTFRSLAGRAAVGGVGVYFDVRRVVRCGSLWISC